jgi:cytochrome d ubiquinol oxidase subunit II
MLLALIFRGVAFEFRWVARSSKGYWNFAFAAGSLIAGFSQGIVLGALLQGIEVRNGQFAGGTFDWLTPFSLLCGLGVVAGYGLLGATWLILRTEGTVAQRSRDQAKVLLLVVLVAMAIVSLWTPLQIERIAARWFTLPNLLYLSPIPLVTALLAFMVWKWLNDGRENAPFVGTIGLFLLGYAGIVISSFPYLVPPSLTIWQTAAAPSSQIFMLIGTVFLLPVILGYIVFVYWLFWGKIREGEGYH